MPYTTEGKNAMLDALAAIAPYVGLHTAVPSSRVPNEVTGGSPAYARKANTWTRASDASLAHANQPAFDVPADTAVTHVGFWSAPAGGVCWAFAPVAREVFSTQGLYVLREAVLDLKAA